jgi:hypothetical protein
MPTNMVIAVVPAANLKSRPKSGAITPPPSASLAVAAAIKIYNLVTILCYFIILK